MAAHVVEIVGHRPQSVSLPGRFEPQQRTVAFRCSSGERIERDYRGVPLVDVLASADLPDGTTHLLIEGIDGYRACVALADAIDGLLALSDGVRFVAPDVVGPRNVSGVTRIEAIELDPNDDPEALERLVGDGEDRAEA